MPLPVSKFMVPRNEWSQLRAETTVADAIKLLRIIAADSKQVIGCTAPLVLR